MGGNPFPCLFRFLDVSVIPWLVAPFRLQSQQWQTESISHCTTLTSACIFPSWQPARSNTKASPLRSLELARELGPGLFIQTEGGPWHPNDKWHWTRAQGWVLTRCELPQRTRHCASTSCLDGASQQSCRKIIIIPALPPKRPRVTRLASGSAGIQVKFWINCILIILNAVHGNLYDGVSMPIFPSGQ